MRDSQRSKLYAAERASGLQLDKRHCDMSIEQCQALVDKIIGSAYVRRKYGRRVPTSLPVYATHGGGRATHSGGYHRDRTTGEVEWRGSHIRLGVWARQPFIVIHEVAHHLAGLSHGHDWRFAEITLDLTRHFLGAEAAAQLRAAYKAGRVRFRKPVTRTITPERRAALVIQLAAAREARARQAADPAPSPEPTEPSAASDPPS